MKYEVRFTTQFKNENLKHSSFIKGLCFSVFAQKSVPTEQIFAGFCVLSPPFKFLEK